MPVLKHTLIFSKMQRFAANISTNDCSIVLRFGFEHSSLFLLLDEKRLCGLKSFFVSVCLCVCVFCVCVCVCVCVFCVCVSMFCECVCVCVCVCVFVAEHLHS